MRKVDIIDTCCDERETEGYNEGGSKINKVQIRKVLKSIKPAAPSRRYSCTYNTLS